jgi:hypothetical protein
VVAVGEVAMSPGVDGDLDVHVLTDEAGSLSGLPLRRPRGAFAMAASPVWIESSAPR